MGKVVRYKLQLVRVVHEMDAYFPGTTVAIVRERGDYLKANGEDVTIRGYAAAITRAGELNNAMEASAKNNGWRFHTIQVTMEEQENLFDDVTSDDSGTLQLPGLE